MFCVAQVASSEVATEKQNTVVLKTFKLYHSVTQNEFQSRGTIQLVKEEDGSLVSKFAEDDLEVIGDDILTGLDESVAKNGFYKVKIEDEETGMSVLASTPSCDVKRAKFREEIALTLGNTGSIISLSFKPLVSPLAAPCNEQKRLVETKNEKGYKFRTSVSFSTSKPALTIPAVLPSTNPPPGYDWIKRAKKAATNDKESGDNSQGPDAQDTGFDPEAEAAQQATANQSFLRKYWYIILPVALMSLTGGEEPPQQGGAASAGAAAAGAAAAGASSGSRQRRGKRG